MKTLLLIASNWLFLFSYFLDSKMCIVDWIDNNLITGSASVSLVDYFIVSHGRLKCYWQISWIRFIAFKILTKSNMPQGIKTINVIKGYILTRKDDIIYVITRNIWVCACTFYIISILILLYFLFELPQKLNHVFIYVEFPILSAKMRFDYVRHQLTRALQMF